LPKGHKNTLSKPSKAQVTLLPAFSESCEMKNREPQNRFHQPVKDCDRHSATNSRVFLKAKIIQTSSQFYPDSDNFFQFSGQSSSNPNFGQANLGLERKIN